MIKNYIFDFGNVLGQFYSEQFVSKYVSDGKTIRIISDIVFDRIYWDKLDEGTITDAEVKEQFCARLPDDLKEVACRVYDNWINDLIPVPGMEKLIRDLHNSGKKIYLLSNICKTFPENYHKVGWIKELFDCFDGFVFSGETGLVKPNADIFEHLLEKYNLNREECLFTDDRDLNIEGAKKVGIKGYLFDGDAEKLRKYLSV